MAKRTLDNVTFRDELAESANLAVNGPPPPLPAPVALAVVPEPVPVAAPKPPRAKPLRVQVQDDEEEMEPAVPQHVFTVKLDDPVYWRLKDIAVTRAKRRRAGKENVGELVREAIDAWLDARDRRG
jgi:hypothetical protein